MSGPGAVDTNFDWKGGKSFIQFMLTESVPKVIAKKEKIYCESREPHYHTDSTPYVLHKVKQLMKIPMTYHEAPMSQ